jgi:membrane-bound metal-dependent hydrolase YbcI (DUF457 family)
MDLLTHVFLPLTVAYVLYPGLFTHPLVYTLAGFGLTSDFDKFLGQPGLFHSLVAVGPLCLVVLAVGNAVANESHARLVAGFVGSHLLLDVVDGGPVPLLYPFVERGIGLQFPARTVFGRDPLGISVEGQVVATRVTAPRPGFNEYTFIDAAGVAWLLAFLVIYFGLGHRHDREYPTPNSDQS